MRKYRIAAIGGDGIGPEVLTAGIACIQEVGRLEGFEIVVKEFPWGSAYYRETGLMMPTDGLDQLKSFDAIYFGAVGFPGVPDHVSLWNLLIPMRRGLKLYVNLRPVRLLPGMISPLRDREPGDIDYLIVRENNEGEYSEVGGRVYTGTEQEAVSYTHLTLPPSDLV